MYTYNQRKEHMKMTHSDIMKQPNGTVSRLLTLLKLDSIRSSASSKRDVLLESLEYEQDQAHVTLYAKWFDELVQQADRAINDLYQASEENV